MSYRYDAIVVLGAVMEWSPKLGQWIFPGFTDNYPAKMVLGTWRALAASFIHEQAPKMLVTGGSQKHPETDEVHSRAVELTKLICELGVPFEKIEVIGKIGASHTIGNRDNLRDYLRAHPEIKRIAILCPRFQLGRAVLMHDADPFFKESGIETTWIVVEAVLKRHDPTFQLLEEAVYKTPEAEVCRQMEEKGIHVKM